MRNPHGHRGKGFEERSASRRTEHNGEAPNDTEKHKNFFHNGVEPLPDQNWGGKKSVDNDEDRKIL